MKEGRIIVPHAPTASADEDGSGRDYELASDRGVVLCSTAKSRYGLSPVPARN